MDSSTARLLFDDTRKGFKVRSRPPVTVILRYHDTSKYAMITRIFLITRPYNVSRDKKLPRILHIQRTQQRCNFVRRVKNSPGILCKSRINKFRSFTIVSPNVPSFSCAFKFFSGKFLERPRLSASGFCARYTDES